MSPVAVTFAHSYSSLGHTQPPRTGSTKTPTPPTPHVAHSKTMPAPDTLDIARHPSPWHEIAHTLSTTPTPATLSRRGSSPVPASTPLSIRNDTTHNQDSNQAATSTSASSAASSPLVAALSSSQALRDWEARLASPDSDVRRHQLVHPPPNLNTSPAHTGSIQAQLLAPGNGSPVLPPKLAAERDKEGHIEYKLKLIDPSAERFGKLVTQMMWRLKQGKNEAIYELGLADDGTVVGLTRAEMDASLKTLELMASELGATVMILREIVLSGAPTSLTAPSPALSDTSSSVISLSASAHSPEPSTSLWPVQRPDLDHLGRPKKGTKLLTLDGSVDPRKRRVTKRPSRDVQTTVMPQYTARQVVFTPQDDADSDSESHGSASPGAAHKSPASGIDDDIPPFDLELEDGPPPSPLPQDDRTRRRNSKKTVVPEQMQMSAKKSEAKRLKLAKKREERRMDLLRGDGMSPDWHDLNSSDDPFSTPLDSDNSTTTPSLTTHLLAKLPHQPARPSSLRLASPAPSSSTIRPSPDDQDHEGPMWSLSQTPLDSLSLSFADVQIQDISPISSPPSPASHVVTEDGSTVLANSPDGPSPTLAENGVIQVVRPLTGKEMVCVEALVVRKVQHGHGADGDGVGSEEEEECGWGGEDDVWGLGVDSD